MVTSSCGTAGVCRAGLIALCWLTIFSATRANDWPQWLGPKRDGIWREDGILDKFPSGGPKVLWRRAIGGGYSGPAVVGDRLYVMDRQGDSLGKGVEGSGKTGLAGSERVLCLNAQSGEELWKHVYDCTYRIAYPSGPRTTPVVYQGKVYTLGSMGDLRCLDAATGQLHWQKSFVRDLQVKPPLWGWSAHLLVDGDKVFSLVGGEGRAVAAFHKDTGEELWHALTVKEVGYAPPMLFEAGGKRQLVVWHTEAVNSLDPATGTVYWSIRFPEGEPVRPGITVSAPQKEGDRLAVSCIHHGTLMLELAKDQPAAKLLWKGKSDDVSKPDGLHSLMSSVLLKDGHTYGICSFGELRCLDPAGTRLWETFDACGLKKKTIFATAFLVPQGDRCFIFNDRGDLLIARLTPKGYEAIDQAHILEPTLFSRGRDVVWSHPAFARRCAFVRNDKEIICVSLARDENR
jgi:hypothetical protein